MDTKRSIILVLALMVLISFITVSLAEAGRVRGYYRKDGTYVQPYYRTNPDRTPYNNYSFPGNYNPNTGSITSGDRNTYLDHYYNRPNTRSHEPYNGWQRRYNY